MIRVMLVDDLYIPREGVKSILASASDIDIVASASSGEEAVEHFESARPDVILMDMHMPEMNGLKASVHIKEIDPDAKIIFLTSFADEDLVVSAMNAGADGFLYKNVDGSNLLQSIRNVSDNQVIIAGEAARILARKIRDTSFSKQEVLDQKLRARNIIFTNREMEVAILLMKDKTNPYIAKHIHLSEGTVKNYISEIYYKLNKHRRLEVIGYLNGLIEEQDLL